MVVGITGAPGFIGSALARGHLDAGDPIRCPTRYPAIAKSPGIRLVEGDLTRPDARLRTFAEGVTRVRYPIDRIHRELGYRIALPIVAGLQRVVALRAAA